MLKPIHQVACSPALVACQQLMRRFALWLCEPATTNAHLNQQGLQPPVLVSAIEANWLWEFLQRIDAGQSLLSRAEALAAMPLVQKVALAGWVRTVSALPAQFQPAPTLWPINRPVANESDWKAFKALMEAFYEKAFKSVGGIPFQADGTPTAAGGVNYAYYVGAFRTAHRLNAAPNAREVCVLCGGLLGDTPHIDHWIIKSAFPLLSVCADNLQLICSTCNEAPNKGDKPVYSNGSFNDWFHPYLRPGTGTLLPKYALPEFSVRCTAISPAEQHKVVKLDELLNLSSRWTREFKAEYVKHQDLLRRREKQRVENGLPRYTLQEVDGYAQQWAADLSASEPHFDVHVALGLAMRELARTRAWHTELATV